MRVNWTADVHADHERRTITGTVVPYGVIGRTSFGPLVVEAGALHLPADLGRIKLLLDHDPAGPVGYGVRATEHDDGLEMAFKVPDGPAGDAALADAAPERRLRDGLSIGAELDEYTEGEDAVVVHAARLREVSLVSIPAYDDARVTHVAATRNGETMPATTDLLPAFPARPRQPIPAAHASSPTDPEPEPEPQPEGDPPEPAQASTPAALTAGRRAPARAVRGGPVQNDLSLAAVGRLMASTGGDFQQVRAALTNITTTDVDGLIRPQYLTDMMEIITPGTPCINAFSSGPLTSNPLRFPYWETLPVVDVVTGEKVQIPTGPASITTVDTTVKTYAGGNDASVQVIDWSDPDFITEYFKAAAAVYASKIESVFEAGLQTFASPVATSGTLVGDIGAVFGAVMGRGYPGRMLMIMSGDVWGDLFVELAGAGPGLFGIVNPAFPVPEVIVAPYFPPGTLIFALSSAAKSFQNPGAPVRLRAVDVSLLGVDLGVYGYFAAVLLHANAIYKVTGLVTTPLSSEGRNELRRPIDLLSPSPSDLPSEPAPAVTAKSSAKASE